MAEHATTAAVVLDWVDWQWIRHYQSKNPNGAFYVVTDQWRVLDLNISPGSGGHRLRVKDMGSTSEGFSFAKIETYGTQTGLCHYGKARLILFVHRKAESYEDLALIAGDEYGSFMSGKRGFRPRYHFVTELANGNLHHSVDAYYLMVQRPGPNLARIFLAEKSLTRLRFSEVHLDRGYPHGLVAYSPWKFNYSRGGDLKVQTSMVKQFGKEHYVGRILSILATYEPMDLSEVSLALDFARTDL